MVQSAIRQKTADTRIGDSHWWFSVGTPRKADVAIRYISVQATHVTLNLTNKKEKGAGTWPLVDSNVYRARCGVLVASWG